MLKAWEHIGREKRLHSQLERLVELYIQETEDDLDARREGMRELIEKLKTLRGGEETS